MEEKNETYGNLFGTIDLVSEEQLDIILNTMTKDQSLYFIIEAIKAAYSRRAFTIGETEVISKAIRIVTKPD